MSGDSSGSVTESHSLELSLDFIAASERCPNKLTRGLPHLSHEEVDGIRTNSPSKQRHTHTQKRSLLVMSWKPSCACPLGWGGWWLQTAGVGYWWSCCECLSEACPNNLIPKGRVESQRMGGAAVTMKKCPPPPNPPWATTPPSLYSNSVLKAGSSEEARDGNAE